MFKNIYNCIIIRYYYFIGKFFLAMAKRNIKKDEEKYFQYLWKGDDMIEKLKKVGK